MFYSEDWFRSDIPTHLHDYIHESAIIREMTLAGDRILIHDRAPTKPTRKIAISFGNDGPVARNMMYFLQQTDVRIVGDGKFEMNMSNDLDLPLSEDQFNAWVYQSINRTVIARMISISKEMALANRINASYLTESPFEATLCGMSSDKNTPAETRSVAVNFLRANAPVINLSDAETVARVRTDNAELFLRFQRSLLAVVAELNGQDPSFEMKAQALFEKEIQPQIDELNRALKKTVATVGGAVILTSSTVLMALLGNAALPFGTMLGLGAAAAAGQSLPSIAEYMSKHKSPAFLWKQITKS